MNKKFLIVLTFFFSYAVFSQSYTPFFHCTLRIHQSFVASSPLDNFSCTTERGIYVKKMHPLTLKKLLTKASSSRKECMFQNQQSQNSCMISMGSPNSLFFFNAVITDATECEKANFFKTTPFQNIQDLKAGLYTLRDIKGHPHWEYAQACARKTYSIPPRGSWRSPRGFPLDLTRKHASYNMDESGEDLDIEHMTHILFSRNQKSLRNNLLKNFILQFKQLKQSDQKLDTSLVLSIAYYEASQNIISNENRLINSMNSGGLDSIGGIWESAYIDKNKKIRRLYFPKSAHCEKWKGVDMRNEKGIVRSVELPQKQLIIGYGVYIHRIRAQLTYHAFHSKLAQKYNWIEKDMSEVSLGAKRVWQMIFFSGNGEGLKIMKRLAQLVKEGLAHGLNDILTHPKMRLDWRVRRGILMAANSQILDQMLPLNIKDWNIGDLE